MKIFILLFLFSNYCFAIYPPIISPLRSSITFGSSISLTASGCSGTVLWSNTQTGTSISISPKQSTYLRARCINGADTSKNSSYAIIDVSLTRILKDTFDLKTDITNIGVKYLATDSIRASNHILPDASVDFRAGNKIILNTPFYIEAGAVFSARIDNSQFDLLGNILLDSLTYPWEILWGPDNYIWMTERTGKISRVNPNTGEIVVALASISDVDYGGTSNGLLGMVIHPDFINNPYIYVIYHYIDDGSKEKIVRYTYDSNTSTLSTPTILLAGINGAYFHNGGRIAIDSNLKLYISTGDEDQIEPPQDDNSMSGKILRINLDGTIPSDNPITNNPMWAKGLRNVQGLVFANNKLYSSMHGNRTDDEINIIVGGGNYGWGYVEGLCDTPEEIIFCNTHTLVDPIKTWTPTIAPAGIDYFNYSYSPLWNNSLLLTSLKQQTLYQLKLSNDGNTIVETNEYIIGQYGRLRDLAISPTGRIFICTSNGINDKLFEITPFYF